MSTASSRIARILAMATALMLLASSCVVDAAIVTPTYTSVGVESRPEIQLLDGMRVVGGDTFDANELVDQNVLLWFWNPL